MTAGVDALVVGQVAEGMVVRDLGTRFGWRWGDRPADRDLGGRLDVLAAGGVLVVHDPGGVVSAVSVSTGGWALLP